MSVSFTSQVVDLPPVLFAAVPPVCTRVHISRQVPASKHFPEVVMLLFDFADSYSFTGCRFPQVHAFPSSTHTRTPHPLLVPSPSTQLSIRPNCNSQSNFTTAPGVCRHHFPIPGIITLGLPLFLLKGIFTSQSKARSFTCFSPYLDLLWLSIYITLGSRE